jgi:hypothetical protein
VSKEGRVAVEVVSRNVDADDGRLRDVHFRVAAAGRSFGVDGSGDRWEDAARVGWASQLMARPTGTSPAGRRDPRHQGRGCVRIHGAFRGRAVPRLLQTKHLGRA